MGQKTIVGVTDAVASQRAVDWAAERAAARGDRLELISVLGDEGGVVGEGEVIEDALPLTRSLLEREAERVRALGVPAEARVERGKPVEQLIEASKGAALLVIGCLLYTSDAADE